MDNTRRVPPVGKDKFGHPVHPGRKCLNRVPSLGDNPNRCPRCLVKAKDPWARDRHFLVVHILNIAVLRSAKSLKTTKNYDGPLGRKMRIFGPNRYCQEPEKDMSLFPTRIHEKNVSIHHPEFDSISSTLATQHTINASPIASIAVKDDKKTKSKNRKAVLQKMRLRTKV